MRLPRLLCLLLLTFYVPGCEEANDPRESAALGKEITALRREVATLSSQLQETSKKVTQLQEADQRLNRAFFDLSVEVDGLQGVREPNKTNPSSPQTRTSAAMPAPTTARSSGDQLGTGQAALAPLSESEPSGRSARRSTGEVSCGDIWRMIDDGSTRESVAQALGTTLAVVNDCEEEPRRRGQWKAR